jgi:dihydropteroate synthase
MEEDIKQIIDGAIDIERWGEKTNDTYTFIDDEERKEMVESILRELNKKGYHIVSKTTDTSIH